MKIFIRFTSSYFDGVLIVMYLEFPEIKTSLTRWAKAAI
jgi:hypothetical protein